MIISQCVSTSAGLLQPSVSTSCPFEVVLPICVLSDPHFPLSGHLDHASCPYYISLHFLTIDMMTSCCPIICLTSSLVTWQDVSVMSHIHGYSSVLRFIYRKHKEKTT